MIFRWNGIFIRNLQKRAFFIRINFSSGKPSASFNKTSIATVIRCTHRNGVQSLVRSSEVTVEKFSNLSAFKPTINHRAGRQATVISIINNSMLLMVVFNGFEENSITAIRSVPTFRWEKLQKPFSVRVPRFAFRNLPFYLNFGVLKLLCFPDCVPRTITSVPCEIVCSLMQCFPWGAFSVSRRRLNFPGNPTKWMPLTVR